MAASKPTIRKNPLLSSEIPLAACALFKAKKFARIDPKRKKLVALLEQMAEIEETNAVEIDSKVNMVSPAPARLERASETRVVLVRHGGDLRAATSANAFVSPVRWMA